MVRSDFICRGWRCVAFWSNRISAFQKADMGLANRSLFRPFNFKVNISGTSCFWSMSRYQKFSISYRKNYPGVHKYCVCMIAFGFDTKSVSSSHEFGIYIWCHLTSSGVCLMTLLKRKRDGFSISEWELLHNLMQRPICRLPCSSLHAMDVAGGGKPYKLYRLPLHSSHWDLINL